METTEKNIENTNVVANVNETNMNQESTNQNIDKMTINKNENGMKKLNLLFIEGNRQEINKENVKTSYSKSNPTDSWQQCQSSTSQWKMPKTR